MQKFATLALTVLCITAASCQSYQTGLQQGMAGADETAAKGALRTIALAQQSYSVSNSGDFGSFEQLYAADYLDKRFNFSKPAIKDYVLTMTVTPKGAGQAEGFYGCNADPVRPGAQTGRHFYIDSTSSELHFSLTEPATAKDPVVQP